MYMKAILGILFLAGATWLGTSIYDLSFTRLDGTTVNMGDFRGKKLIVFAFNSRKPDKGLLQRLDSVQRRISDSVVLIAIPALDLDSTSDLPSLTHLKDSLGLVLNIGQPTYVRKASGASQMPLFQWLTSVSQNTHFDRDVEEEGMLFFVNTKGELYSIINNGLSQALLPEILQKGNGK